MKNQKYIIFKNTYMWILEILQAEPTCQPPQGNLLWLQCLHFNKELRNFSSCYGQKCKDLEYRFTSKNEIKMNFKSSYKKYKYPF